MPRARAYQSFSTDDTVVGPMQRNAAKLDILVRAASRRRSRDATRRLAAFATGRARGLAWLADRSAAFPARKVNATEVWHSRILPRTGRAAGLATMRSPDGIGVLAAIPTWHGACVCAGWFLPLEAP